MSHKEQMNNYDYSKMKEDLSAVKVIYVEGVNDEPFYRAYLCRFHNSLTGIVKVIEIKTHSGTGGCIALEMHFNEFTLNKANTTHYYIFDADLKRVTNSYITHNNIYTTQGYSVENSLVHPQILKDFFYVKGENKDQEINQIDLYKAQLLPYMVINCICKNNGVDYRNKWMFDSKNLPMIDLKDIYQSCLCSKMSENDFIAEYNLLYQEWICKKWHINFIRGKNLYHYIVRKIFNINRHCELYPYIVPILCLDSFLTVNLFK